MPKLLVNVDVADLAKATDFYTRAFDLVLGRRFGPFAVELLGADAPLYLLVKPPGSSPYPGAGASRDYQRHWTPVHLDFAVDDLERAIARAEAAGARRDGDIDEHEWGRILVMSDPFGNGFCLLQFKGAGYDEVATG